MGGHLLHEAASWATKAIATPWSARFSPAGTIDASSSGLLCPIRPTIHYSSVDLPDAAQPPPVETGAAVAEVQEGWDNIHDADVLPFSEVIGPSETDDLLDSEGDGAVQPAIPVPEPPQPSKAEVDKHNLTAIALENH